MRFPTSTRTSLIALIVGGALYSGAADAQVKMFDSVPTQEQLRNILVPEEPAPSASRSITIAKPNVPKGPSNVQTTAMPGIPQPQSDPTPAPQAAPAPAPTQSAAMSVPKAKSAPQAEEPADRTANAVAFHVNFASNSAAIPPDSIPYLNAIADLLKQERKLTIAVEGHTDATGSDEYNLELSKKRAEAVAAYLAQQGVANDQLMAIGKGKTEPLLANHYDSRNRRVQFNRISFKRES